MSQEPLQSRQTWLVGNALQNLGPDNVQQWALCFCGPAPEPHCQPAGCTMNAKWMDNPVPDTRACYSPQHRLMGWGVLLEWPSHRGSQGALGKQSHLHWEAEVWTLRSSWLYSLGMAPTASAGCCIPLPPSCNGLCRWEGETQKGTYEWGWVEAGGTWTPASRLHPQIQEAQKSLRCPAMPEGIAPCQFFYFGFPHTQERQKYRKEQEVEARARERNKLCVPWFHSQEQGLSAHHVLHQGVLEPSSERLATDGSQAGPGDTDL